MGSPVIITSFFFESKKFQNKKMAHVNQTGNCYIPQAEEVVRWKSFLGEAAAQRARDTEARLAAKQALDFPGQPNTDATCKLQAAEFEIAERDSVRLAEKLAFREEQHKNEVTTKVGIALLLLLAVGVFAFIKVRKQNDTIKKLEAEKKANGY